MNVVKKKTCGVYCFTFEVIIIFLITYLTEVSRKVQTPNIKELLMKSMHRTVTDGNNRNQ